MIDFARPLDSLRNRFRVPDFEGEARAAFLEQLMVCAGEILLVLVGAVLLFVSLIAYG